MFENVRVAAQSRARESGRLALALAPARRRDARRRSSWRAFGLAARRDELAENLSHGEQRYLEICLALATEPTLLLLDEPTAGMTPGETKEATALIRRIAAARGLTVLLIEHDMSRRHGHLGPHRGAPLRREDRRGRAGADPQRSAGDRGLPRAAGRLSHAQASRTSTPATVRRRSSSASRSRCAPARRSRSWAATAWARRRLMKTAIGFLAPWRGAIEFEGVDLARRAPHEIARLGVGFVPENRRIFPGLTVRENLELGLSAAPDRSAALRRRAPRRGLPPLPAPARAHRAAGQDALRRRAADAGDRPRDDGRRAADPRWTSPRRGWRPRSSGTSAT